MLITGLDQQGALSDDFDLAPDDCGALDEGAMAGLPRRLRQLDTLLMDLPDDSEGMLLSELDGFLAGIIACPDLILPSEWLPMVWGGGDDEHEPVFEDQKQVEKLVRLIMEHYNAIVYDLRTRGHQPVFDVDTRHDETLWEIWISGFERAIHLRPKSWSVFLETNDEDAIAAIGGIMMLGAISRGESDLPKEKADLLTEAAPDLIPQWVETLNAWRMQNATGLADIPPRLSYGRVGRNDPCPCGSGKKWKKCCGLN